MKLPRTSSQKIAIEREISNLKKAKKTLVRNKSKYSPMKFYGELNKINRTIEKLEGKL